MRRKRVNMESKSEDPHRGDTGAMRIPRCLCPRSSSAASGAARKPGSQAASRFHRRGPVMGDGDQPGSQGARLPHDSRATAMEVWSGQPPQPRPL
jgi:hypothetical protein